MLAAMTRCDAIIIGGGAAGLMCAIVAGKRGRTVVVLEKTNKVGKKILMSGGGRCNFTNLYCEPSRFISANPHFCKSALSRYTQHEFIALVEKHNVPYHEKTLGQLFCDNSSKDIVALLLDECADAGAEIVTHCEIDSVTHDGAFSVASNRGRFASDSLVVASGGLSIPRMGASGFGHELARQFGHSVVDTKAGLVPFTFTGAMHELTQRLAGVSTSATVSTPSCSFTEDILFTHRGLSGPAILQASSYWSPGVPLSLDLLPGLDAAGALLRAKSEQPKALLRTVVGRHLPRALATELEDQHWRDESGTALAEFADVRLHEIGEMLQHWVLKPSGTEGYRTAEVTLGGVDTTQLSSRTMESSLQPGLFFIGEVVDVTGHLGGFNFQWAWSSAHAAGLVA